MPETSSDRFISLNQNNGKKTYIYSMPAVQSNEEDESVDLRQLLNVVKHRFRLILAVTLGMTAIVALWTFTREPRYEGSFQLLVESVTDEKLKSELVVLGSERTGLDYKTQIEVLRSPSVLAPIIAKLAAKYPEIEYDELITAKKPPLEIEQIDETKILNVSYVDTDPAKIQFVLDNLAEAYLAYSLEERRIEVKQGIEFVREQLPGVRQRVDELQEKLQVFRQKYNLLAPEVQAELLSTKLVEQEEKYFATQVQLNETKSLYRVLQKQLALEPEQAIAANYLSESPRYQNLLNELQQVEIELAKESSRFTSNTPIVKALQAKKAELRPLLQAEAAKVVGNNSDLINQSPSLSSPSSLRLELNQQYIQAANETQILEIRRQALEKAIAQLTQLTGQMPVIARQYTDLQRQLAVATESLNRFLEAEEKLQLEAAQKALPWQLIATPSVEEDPVSPNPPYNLVLGLLGGLMLGFGSALLAERLDPVFHSIEELQEYVQLPLLGAIPAHKELLSLEALAIETPAKPVQLQIEDNTNSTKSITNTFKRVKNNRKQLYNASSFLEAFRSLSTNIKLLGSDSQINSIVISSSVPAEGKSTISCYLAQAAAAMGQRVLLIDADLRRPQVHHWLKIENRVGLSNILATRINLESVIYRLPQWENLAVVTAGEIPPDSTRLLSSQKMQELMEQLKQDGRYDLIIYDTPPVLGFADGRILAARTDGIVLVIQMNHTDRTLIKQNLDSLKIAQVSVLGIVANQVNRNSGGSSYYYNHYYANR